MGAPSDFRPGVFFPSLSSLSHPPGSLRPTLIAEERRCKMFDATSPFDEALSRPFLDEQPVKKRWSLFTLSTAVSSDHDEPAGKDVPRSASTRYTAPMEEVLFQARREESGEDEEEEGSFVLASAVEEGRVVDANLALMRERHEDISQIHSEMQQLNEIQRELALTVDSQNADIERMSYLAVESAEQADMGLQHILRAHQMLLDRRRYKRRAALAAACGFALVVASLHWALAFDGDGDASGGSPQTGYHP